MHLMCSVSAPMLCATARSLRPWLQLRLHAVLWLDSSLKQQRVDSDFPVAAPFRGLNFGTGQAKQLSMANLTALTGAAASDRESLRVTPRTLVT